MDITATCESYETVPLMSKKFEGDYGRGLRLNVLEIDKAQSQLSHSPYR